VLTKSDRFGFEPLRAATVVLTALVALYTTLQDLAVRTNAFRAPEWRAEWNSPSGALAVMVGGYPLFIICETTQVFREKTLDRNCAFCCAFGTIADAELFALPHLVCVASVVAPLTGSQACSSPFSLGFSKASAESIIFGHSLCFWLVS
jgi:hypothetical protein